MLIRKEDIFSDTKVIKGSKLKLLNENLTTMTICNLILENGIYLEDIQVCKSKAFSFCR